MKSLAVNVCVSLLWCGVIGLCATGDVAFLLLWACAWLAGASLASPNTDSVTKR